MGAVRLKNGTEELDTFVAVTMGILHDLADSDPFALLDLVTVCRDPAAYEPFGPTRELLADLKLWHNHESIPHESVRNVVLSAVAGDGFDMVLGSPLAE